MIRDPFSRDHAPVHGAVEWLRPDLRAVTAGNVGPMTFTGTRSYLLGRTEVAVIDPGPDDPAHRDALLAALGPEARVVAVLVTHAHRDHSAGAARLAELVSAPVLAHGDPAAARSDVMQRLADAAGPALGGGEGIDTGFVPDRRIGEGDVISGDGWQLAVRHLPGHLGDHLVFEAEDFVFSGDLLMGWATTLISPPDGDLAMFRTSIARLRDLAPSVCFPGHGPAVRDPVALCSHLLTHRAERESSILAALAQGPARIAELVAGLYAAIDPALHKAASRNVLAHLVDLESRGIVVCDGGISVDGLYRLA